MSQLPLFLPDSPWRPPEMVDMVSWQGARRVAVDVETYDPHLKETGPSVRTGGHLAGIGFAIDGGPKHYLPFRHEHGDNLDEAQVLRYFKDQFKIFDGEVVGANLAYDLDWLWEAGVDMPMVKAFRDVLIAEPCINENKFFYSLDSVSKDWIGDQKDKTLMLEAARSYGMKKDSELGAYIHLLPARFVGLYGEQDVALPLRVLELQEREIEAQGIRGVWDLESEVLPVLVRMRRRGVAVDEQRLLEVEVRCSQERREASDLITRESGVAVGPDDAMKKGLLVEALRAVGHNITADDSVDKHYIARHEDSCEVVAALGRLRKWDTLRKLSIDPVKSHLVNGRIHCSFNQMAADKDGGRGVKGARYGRLSCEHVNMQQQPARDEEIGPLWRRIYMPDEGGLWAACDYSQQDPRVLIHWAETLAEMGLPDWPMKGAREAAQRYRDDPATDNHQMVADLAGIDRKPAKILFLGIIYGMGQEKLCNDLGLPMKIITLQRGPRKGHKMKVAGPEAEGMLNKLHTELPFLKEMERLCAERASERGYITTLSGRRCRFKMGDDGLNYWGTQKALNRLVQGSSADQTKRALVEVDRAGHNLQLQVHDELDLTVASREEAEEVGRIMRECVPLRVPAKVDVEVGPSWGEAA